jgi:hypothetical protein
MTITGDKFVRADTVGLVNVSGCFCTSPILPSNFLGVAHEVVPFKEGCNSILGGNPNRVSEWSGDQIKELLSYQKDPLVLYNRKEPNLVSIDSDDSA